MLYHCMQSLRNRYSSHRMLGRGVGVLFSARLRMGPKTVFLSGLTMLGPFCGVDLLLYGLSSCAIIVESLLVAQDALEWNLPDFGPYC